MDIRCPSCNKLFRVADEKIAGKGIRFKCSKCSEVITITKDDFEMDLLAREAEATEPVHLEAPQPATSPSPPTTPQPSIKPVPSQPILSAEPEAREYQPPQEHDIPPAALSDFDFSEPHAAATAAAHPEEGFGGQDFSFNAEPEQGSVLEAGTSLEGAAEGEAALQFPNDLVSEPKRKPVFGAPSVNEPATVLGSVLEQEQKPKTGPAFTPPSFKSAPDMQEEDEIDLGAALAMPKGPEENDPAATHQEPVLGTAQTLPKGPVITPELLAQMMKRSTGLNKSASQVKVVPHADEDTDLGAALAMPKTTGTAGKEEAEYDSKTDVGQNGFKSSLFGKRALVIGGIALVLVAVLAALYYQGFLWGKREQKALQKPQPVSQPARQTITPEGLSIVDPIAFIDTERGDLVITGKIQNATDKPKAGWYLVIEVRDAKEAVLSTVKMVNGVQIYSKAEHDILAKRGVKVEDLEKKITSSGEGMVSPKGSVPFEVRIMNPPAGSARFLPTLYSFELSSLVEGIKAAQGHP
jgi:predicted Zn finger-like uncharacterized protein